MANQAYLNGNDIYIKYRALFVKGTYKELAKMPPVKDYISNESRLEDGIKYTFQEDGIKLQKREVSIKFLIDAESESSLIRYRDDLFNDVTKGQFILHVPKLACYYRLVYLNTKEISYYGKKRCIFAMNFIEPNPKNRRLQELDSNEGLVF